MVSNNTKQPVETGFIDLLIWKSLLVLVREPPEILIVGTRIDHRQLGIAEGIKPLGTQLLSLLSSLIAVMDISCGR
jgi:hypothetical protein